MNLSKRSSKIRYDVIKYDIIDYGVTMGFQKKSFIEPAESCLH